VTRRIHSKPSEQIASTRADLQCGTAAAKLVHFDEFVVA
jgi:hypothetical protein